MAWVDSLAAHISANSLDTLGTDLFVGMMVDSGQSGPVTGLGRYKGRTRETMGANGVDIPMLQVAVRAPSYAAAETRIEAIRDLLRQIKNQTVQGTYFLRVMPDGTVKDIQRDEKGRQQFTADFEVWL